MMQWNHGRWIKLQRGLAVFLALLLCVGTQPVLPRASAEDTQDELMVEGLSQEEAPKEQIVQEGSANAISTQSAGEAHNDDAESLAYYDVTEEPEGIAEDVRDDHIVEGQSQEEAPKEEDTPPRRFC